MDLGRVSVHADDESARGANLLAAEACAVGRNVFAPANVLATDGSGTKLLAHELWHAANDGHGRPGRVWRGKASSRDNLPEAFGKEFREWAGMDPTNRLYTDEFGELHLLGQFAGEQKDPRIAIEVADFILSMKTLEVAQQVNVAREILAGLRHVNDPTLVPRIALVAARKLKDKEATAALASSLCEGTDDTLRVAWADAMRGEGRTAEIGQNLTQGTDPARKKDGNMTAGDRWVISERRKDLVTRLVEMIRVRDRQDGLDPSKDVTPPEALTFKAQVSWLQANTERIAKAAGPARVGDIFNEIGLLFFIPDVGRDIPASVKGDISTLRAAPQLEPGERDRGQRMLADCDVLASYAARFMTAGGLTCVSYVLIEPKETGWESHCIVVYRSDTEYFWSNFDRFEPLRLRPQPPPVSEEQWSRFDKLAADRAVIQSIHDTYRDRIKDPTVTVEPPGPRGSMPQGIQERVENLRDRTP